VKPSYLRTALLALSILCFLGCEDEEAPPVSAAAGGSSGNSGQGGVVGQGGAGTGGAAGAEPGGSGGAGEGPGGGAGEAGVAGASGSSGQGGAEDTGGRGELADFPETCSDSCAAACTRLLECGGGESKTFPLSAQECIDRCKLADKGPQGLWSDQSTNFRCCTAQEDCAAVKNCGGWLKHPDTVASCDRVCECVFGGASIAARWSRGLAPPAGYAWSDSELAVEGGERPLNAGASGLVEVEGAGKIQVLRFSTTPSAALLDRIGAERRVLPTFRDGAGRFAAATGVVYVRASGAQARAKADAVLASHGLGALAPAFPGGRVLRSAGDPWAALAALAVLQGLDGVHAELDMLRRYERRSVPNDPLFSGQWHLKNTGQNGATVGVDGRVDEAWDLTQGDPQVVIAVNDDGVDLDHPEFKDRLLPAMNFPEDWKVRLQNGTFGGHGTPCAGVAAAASDNDLGGAGVCPRCRILPHLLGETQGIGFSVTDGSVAQGFVAMVDAGAWVISNSWGLESGDPNFASTGVLPPISDVVKDAFDYAETKGRGGKGTLILFAAGNSNDDIDAYAGYENNLAIGSVDDTGLKSYYSSFGPTLDLAAPSNGGLQGITTTSPSTSGDGFTDSFGGTSSACPFAAGVAGLVFSANPELTAAEVRAILRETARKIDLAGGSYENGVSPYYGSGLVNAAAAVRMASGQCQGAGCVAPSDDCKENCGTGEVCAACRTDADCKGGSACQAVPGVAAQICVAKAPAEGCPSGTKLLGDFCIPDRSFCGTCQASEGCNGSDDDCNGQVNDGLEGCSVAQRCLGSDDDCPEGQVCAATICVKACKSNSDCDGTGRCRKVKNRYGQNKSAKGCGLDPLRACKISCESVASTVVDEDRDAFTECMQDGEVACGSVFPCLGTLPIGP
jgi:subtilisin family serine protease